MNTCPNHITVLECQRGWKNPTNTLKVCSQERPRIKTVRLFPPTSQSYLIRAPISLFTAPVLQARVWTNAKTTESLLPAPGSVLIDLMITILQKRQDLPITSTWCKKNVQSASACRQSFTVSIYGYSQPIQSHVSCRNTHWSHKQSGNIIWICAVVLFLTWRLFISRCYTGVREVTYIFEQDVWRTSHGVSKITLSQSVKNFSVVCNTPLHTLRNQKEQHTYPSIKQWTIADLQESLDQRDCFTEWLREATPWCEDTERRQLRLEMSLNNDIGTM